MKLAVAAFMVFAVLVAACGAGSASPTTRPTLRLASVPPPGPDLAGPSGPQDAPSVGPSDSAPGLAPAVSLPPSPSGSFPGADEGRLLALLAPAVRAGCQRAGPFYPGEVASVSCGDGLKIPFVYYSLFADPQSMSAGYALDLAGALSRPVPTGTCASGNYEGPYSVRGRAAGRIWCGVGNSAGQTYRLIEWTRDSLATIGLITSADLSWAQLEQFWRGDAGPIG